LWGTGVSTSALRSRLNALKIATSAEISDALELTPQALLRRYWHGGEGDPITERMTKAATRRFPDWIKAAHLEKIAQGNLGKETLAWMLGIEPSEIEVEEPEASPQYAAVTRLLDQRVG